MHQYATLTVVVQNAYDFYIGKPFLLYNNKTVFKYIQFTTVQLKNDTSLALNTINL